MLQESRKIASNRIDVNIYIYICSSYLPRLYLLLFCQELTTVTNYCLVLFMMYMPFATNTELCSSSNLAHVKII